MARRAFESVNATRRSAGVPELEWDEKAAAAAQAHSRAMATRFFFSHDDPVTGQVGDRLRAVGARWQTVGENIFELRGHHDPVKTAVNGWLSSAGHRANILDRRFTRTGIGVAGQADGTLYFTQVFFAPL
jgi:uncharacterized protein YkwD